VFGGLAPADTPNVTVDDNAIAHVFRAGVLPMDVIALDGLLEVGVIQVGLRTNGFAHRYAVSSWAADAATVRLDLALATLRTLSGSTGVGGIGCISPWR
jgi:hypothetical protein